MNLFTGLHLPLISPPLRREKLPQTETDLSFFVQKTARWFEIQIVSVTDISEGGLQINYAKVYPEIIAGRIYQ